MTNPAAIPPPFHYQQVQADALTTSVAAAAFGHWLNRNCPSRISIDDVRLAVYEALANAAEHAYRPDKGCVDLSAYYDGTTDTLSVIVRDHGQWREAPTGTTSCGHGDPRLRGRGMPLMRGLADQSEFHGHADGTTVDLRWTGASPTG